MRKIESCTENALTIPTVVFVMFFPVMGIAGSLEPISEPAPTMKTMDQIPPTWSQSLTCDTATTCQRYEVVLDGNGVIDKETGLVWEKTLSFTHYQTWGVARAHCASLDLGGRKGWHLPTVEQFLSVLDTSVPGEIKLPPGHPFIGLEPGGYWTATSDYSTPSFSAYWAAFNGSVGGVTKDGTSYAWCVRGGEPYEGQ